MWGGAPSQVIGGGCGCGGTGLPHSFRQMQAPPASYKDCGLRTVATQVPFYLWSSQLAKSVGKLNSWVARFNE